MKLELIKETKLVKNGHETVFFIEKDGKYVDNSLTMDGTLALQIFENLKKGQKPVIRETLNTYEI